MLMRDMDKAVARFSAPSPRGDHRRFRRLRRGRHYLHLHSDRLSAQLRRRCLRYIPRRIEDGYGLSCDAIRGLHDQGAT